MPHSPNRPFPSKVRLRTLLLALLTTWCCAPYLLACQAAPQRGLLEARWTAPDGHSEMIPFSFEAIDADHGGFFTTLGRGGEHYSGPYVLVRESTKDKLVTEVWNGMSSPEWEVWDEGADDTWHAQGISFGAFAHFYTGRAVASLTGNRGTLMRCQLQLDRPDQGLLAGGTGQCQTTARDRITLSFEPE
jgi:hypothetical protein